MLTLVCHGGRQLCLVKLLTSIFCNLYVKFAGTLIMRTITMPIAIFNQRNAGQMQVHMPKLQELQGKLQEARIRNDQLASKMNSFLGNRFMKKNKIVIFSYENRK